MARDMRPPRKAHDRLPSGPEIEVRIERLLHGPGSLARSPDGRVVFLDGGLPGERVRACVEKESREFLRARIVRTLDPPSADRRQPPCPVVTLCGGCPWQALEYAAQVEAKQEIVLRELEKTCRRLPERIEEPLVGSQWGGRHRIRLAVHRPAGGEVVVGYRRRGSHDVVPITECVIARPELEAALPLARHLAQRTPGLQEVELTIDDHCGLRLRGTVRTSRAPQGDVLWSQLCDAARHLALEPVVLRGAMLVSVGSGAPWRVEMGDIDQRIEVAEGLEIAVPLGVFTQVNLGLNRDLVAAVVEAARVRPDLDVIDLYCGAGNLSLPLARAGARVVGIDVDERAIAAASASASLLGLGSQSSFEASLADPRALGRIAGGFDLAVLDPPRAGAAEVLPALLDRSPTRLLYVSCDVATFGRDARKIVDRGWHFSSLRLIDLTPQSHRAEVLGVFELT